MNDIKVGVIGTGYVGLVMGACIADAGVNVCCIDKDHDKIRKLEQGIVDIHEKHLPELVQRNLRRKRLTFSTSLEKTKDINLWFITVDTPLGEEGGADVSNVMSVAEELGNFIMGPCCIVLKSTVPVGTTQKFNKIIQDRLTSRGTSINVNTVYNPEFLREGTSVDDFRCPDRVVIGMDHQSNLWALNEVYDRYLDYMCDTIITSTASAEMIKYASNCMLATRISFMNEMANICEAVGADINKVREGMGYDDRIGDKYLEPGCGYGGSCLPRDVKVLMHTAKVNNIDTHLMDAVDHINDNRPSVLVNKVKERLGGLDGKTVAIWGVAFKPGTNDVRCSPAVGVITALIKARSTVHIYDPVAIDDIEKYYRVLEDGIHYFDDKYDALVNADALIIITEWEEFRFPDFLLIHKNMSKPLIFDGRNMYDRKEINKYPIEYYQLGVGK